MTATNMKRNASLALSATLSGDRDSPRWTFSLHRNRGTTLVFSESESHPEEPPLLRLANVCEDEIVGEIWFYPEDLPSLVAELREQLVHCRLRPGEERVEQLDLLEPPRMSSERPRRPGRAVRQYYGDFAR